MRELILYATPGGPLGEACARFFDRARDVRPTTAQAYPPHISLTGFFHREGDRVRDALASARGAVADALAAGDDDIVVEELLATDGWVGLAVTSPWLAALAADFADRHGRFDDEDDVRLKHWLHLSLAYGDGIDLHTHSSIARALVDREAAVAWTVGLWERRADGSWLLLT